MVRTAATPLTWGWVLWGSVWGTPHYISLVMFVLVVCGLGRRWDEGRTRISVPKRLTDFSYTPYDRSRPSVNFHLSEKVDFDISAILVGDLPFWSDRKSPLKSLCNEGAVLQICQPQLKPDLMTAKVPC